MENNGEHCTGGRGGIRTHGTLAGTPVFKTGALNHSATLPSLDVSDLAGGCGRGKRQFAAGHDATPASGPQVERSAVQPNAKASKLEQSSTRLAVVRARNPLETMSWLRMIHLPLRCSSESIKAFRIPDRDYRVIPSAIPGRQPEPLAFWLKPWNGILQMHEPRRFRRSPGPSPL